VRVILTEEGSLFGPFCRRNTKSSSLGAGLFCVCVCGGGGKIISEKRDLSNSGRKKKWMSFSRARRRPDLFLKSNTAHYRPIEKVLLVLSLTHPPTPCFRC
jgi:hypothetical protein